MLTKVICERLIALIICSTYIIEALLFEISLEFTRVSCTEEDLISTSDENIAGHSRTVIFKC